eukprot:gene49176-65906_t
MKKIVLKEHGIEGLIAVLDASKRSCLQKFEKDLFRPRGYLRILQLAGNRKFSAFSHQNRSSNTGKKRQSHSSSDFDISLEQDLALAAVWDWRDRVARAEDESVSYIMSNSELIRIGLAMPREEAQLLRSCRPLSAVTVTRVAEIIAAINARLENGMLVLHDNEEGEGDGVVDKNKKITSPKNVTMNMNMNMTTSITAMNRRSAAATGRSGSAYDTVFTFTPALPPV